MEQLKKLARLLFVYRKFLFFAGFLILFAAPAAQALGDFTQALSDCNSKYNQECYVTDVNANTLSVFVCAMGGAALQCDEVKFGAGVIGITNNMIAGIYSAPPASGVYYAMDRLQHFGVVQPAYAQEVGIGFSGLQPLLPIWRAFRNFSYIIFAIVFVVMGFMIMFKVQLSPQTAVTIQSAIPRIVIALLLVTFSYAIVGFVIDFIYISIALVVLIFEQIPGIDVLHLQESYLEGGFLTAIGSIMGVLGTAGSGAVIGGTAFITFLGGLIAGAVNAPLFHNTFLSPFLAAPAFAGLTGALLVGGIAVVLFALVILIIIAWLLFKLFLELLKAYIAIIIALIIAPLQIALGVIPGTPGFGGWFKALIANALVFPAVAFVLILARVLTQLISFSPNLWHPPLLMAGSVTDTVIPVLIGLGFLFIVPQVPPAIKKAFGIEGLGFNPLGAIAAGIGVTTAGVRGGYDKYRSSKAEKQQLEQTRLMRRIASVPTESEFTG